MCCGVKGAVSFPRSPDTRPEVASGHLEGCPSCPHHTPEFRQRAVQLAREGTIPVAKIAKDLGISVSCLRNWMAQADADDNGGGQRLTSTEKKELAELRKRNRLLEQENEILRRAAAYFARENVLPT
jgi:transposase